MTVHVWSLLVNEDSGEVHVGVDPWEPDYGTRTLCHRIVSRSWAATVGQPLTCIDCAEQLDVHRRWCAQAAQSVEIPDQSPADEEAQ